MVSPAPISNMLASAISPITRKFQTPRRPGDADDVRPPDFEIVVDVRAAHEESRNQAEIPAQRCTKSGARRAVHAHRRRLMAVRSRRRLRASARWSAERRSAGPRPNLPDRLRKAPPTKLSSRLSLRICPISRPRPAPSAARIAISLRRPVTRASNRLATLTQASKSSSPTAPSNSKSAGLMFSNNAASSGPP